MTAGAGHAPDDVIEIGQRTIGVMQERLERSEASAASYLLRVTLPTGSGLFSFGNLAQFEQIGYETAMNALADIRTAMDDTPESVAYAAG